MMSAELNAVERQILKVLLENPFISTRQVAAKAGVSWSTAKKCLDSFRERMWVEYRSRKSREYWKAYPPEAVP
jgi:hypothetical protein